MDVYKPWYGWSSKDTKLEVHRGPWYHESIYSFYSLHACHPKSSILFVVFPHLNKNLFCSSYRKKNKHFKPNPLSVFWKPYTMFLLLSLYVWFRFTCGRWLGKMVDDGSTERLLVARLLPQHSDTYGKIHHNYRLQAFYCSYFFLLFPTFPTFLFWSYFSLLFLQILLLFLLFHNKVKKKSLCVLIKWSKMKYTLTVTIVIYSKIKVNISKDHAYFLRVY